MDWTRGDEFVSRLQKAISGSTFLKARWEKIETGLRLHKGREYFIAVSVLLPQLEGIFTDAMIIRGQALDKKGKIVARIDDGSIRLDRRGKPIVLSGWKAKLDHSMISEWMIVQRLTDLFMDTLIPKRNRIVHGSRGNHTSPKLSTQILLAILVLSEEIYQLERKSKARPN